MILYHCSSARNRASILERGLLARFPREHNWPGIQTQPRGVYVTYDPDGWLVTYLRQVRGDDLWEVKVNAFAIGADYLVDQEWEGGLILLENVPPERLRLLVKAEELNERLPEYLQGLD